jgi:hypothetical protein
MCPQAYAGQVIQRLLGHVLEQVGSDLPQGFHHPTLPQSEQGLACLSHGRARQADLFVPALDQKRRFHSLTMPRAPCICKESPENDGQGAEKEEVGKEASLLTVEPETIDSPVAIFDIMSYCDKR